MESHRNMRLEERGTKNGTEPILVLVFRLAVCFLGQQGRASIPLVGFQHFTRLFLRSASAGCCSTRQTLVETELLALEVRKRAREGTGKTCICQDRS